MSKGVSKYCSILNYLRHVDSDLYDLLQDLCLIKILIPNKKGTGLTFLRPDEALLKKLKSLAHGDNPEEAVEALQSMVLLDNVTNLESFKGKGIPTYLKKKLPVKSVESGKVLLTNDAEIKKDPDFSNRKDTSNISVYILSKELVPVDGDDIDVKSYHKAKKEKKGGADLSGGKTRLFENVVTAFCSSDTDPAMELLVAMYGWAKGSNVKNEPAAQKLVSAIEAKASFDTLATLAIIMRPYCKESPYLTGDLFDQFASSYANADFKNFAGYTNNAGAKDLYEGLACKQVATSTLVREAKALASKMSKVTAVELLSNYYQSKQTANFSAKELFAEAELRALSASMLDNEAGRFKQCCSQLLELYQRCNLEIPYMCTKELVSNLGVGFYYSTVYLIARSDALLYEPGTTGDPLTDIANDKAFFSLNQRMQVVLQSKRNASDAVLQTRAGFPY